MGTVTADSKSGREQRPFPAERSGVPYTMRLADGRTVYVEVPGQWAAVDRSGTIAFTREGVAFLDRLRALMMRLERPPTPGHLKSLRAALGLTQEQLARRVGVSKLTVSRWERGALRPGAGSLKALERLRRGAARRGVTLRAD